MSTSPARNSRLARIPDVVLTLDELSAVTAFDLACAEHVIDLFERARPNDPRPREALNAAAGFARGGPRSRAQRMSAPATHRAAKDVSGSAARAAMAAGDTAASAQVTCCISPQVVDVLARYPRAHTRRADVAIVMRDLDTRVRTGMPL